MPVSFIVNGEPRRVEADADTPLLWVLREQLALTGTKFGCGIAACGACTVHVNGAPVRSCSVPLSAIEGQHVTTIEGLAPRDAGDGARHAVQAAWIAQQVPQCGYCQSGMIMAVAALLAKNAAPTDAEIDAAITNICRCGTYERVRRAIRSLAPGGEPRHG
jgi:isoquinoline 1-oxidoreductase alpha subunit